MEFFKKETNIDFMGLRHYTGAITAILWIISIALLFTKGLNFGLDFTGGTQVEARFEQAIDPGRIRNELESKGMHGVRVQQYGSINDILIRVPNAKNESGEGWQELEAPEVSAANSTGLNIQKASAEQDKSAQKADRTAKTATVAKKEMKTNSKEDESQPSATTVATAKGPSAATNSAASNENVTALRVKQILKQIHPDVEIRRVEFVGSEVGEQLFEQGGIAILVSILATMIYIAFRFEYRLAVSAAVGLCHDGVIILGIFSLFGFDFDLATLASVMAVLGYSLNDTIVVFDRVRENFRKVRKGAPIEIMNLSINQTLSRTIMTSWMTLLVVLALLFFGGESLFGFSMAFLVGILVGTFSSIYVSGALALWLGLSRQDLMPRQRVVDDRP